MFLLCAGGDHPVEIARDHVDLDIELSPGGDLAERRLAAPCGG